MVKFLKEYGLNWVGTEASEQNRKDLDVAQITKDLKAARNM